MEVFSWNELLEGKVLRWLKDSCFSGSALAVGGFDGLHEGHRRIISSVLSFHAGHPEVASGAVTFSRPPKASFSRESYSGDLTTIRLKEKIFRSWGLDFVVVIDFSCDFSKMKGKDFLSILKDSCSMQFAAAGSDFRCGYKLDTGVAEMTAYAAQNGFAFTVIDEVLSDSRRISSSFIRQCVAEGRFSEVARLLGRPFSLDCIGVEVTARSSETGSVLIARDSLQQIVPLKGSYEVSVKTVDSDAFQCVLFAESQFLRLDIPPEYGSSRLESIDFI